VCQNTLKAAVQRTATGRMQYIVSEAQNLTLGSCMCDLTVD